MTKTGFLSIVEDRADRTIFQVRARRAEDLTNTFPELRDEVIELPSADYRYRMRVPRLRVATAMLDALEDIDYDSHVKEELSGKDDERYKAYMDCWVALGRLQPGGPYGGGHWDQPDDYLIDYTQETPET
jgi:hypothetical protein